MAVDEDPSSEHARRFRIMFSHDPIIQRISREMHTFKWVPVSWLSEKWGVDVEDWLKGTTQEKRRAYGFDAKVLNGQLSLVLIGPGSHESWKSVTDDMTIGSRAEFARLVRESPSKTKRAHRWLAEMEHIDEERAFEHAFEEIDTDGSGDLDFEEMKAALGLMGHQEHHYSDDQIRQYFSAYDVDGNGRLDFEEFKGLARKLDADDHEDEVLTSSSDGEALFDLTDPGYLDEHGDACYEELYPLSKFACGFCGEAPPR